MNNIIAIMYDFDKTLITKDMQEYTFIPDLGIESSEFWSIVGFCFSIYVLYVNEN